MSPAPVLGESPPLSDADLVVAIDFKQAESYLCLAPTLELARELDLQIEWRYLEAQPRPPVVEAPRTADRGERHLAMRAAYEERDLRRYAEGQGLDLGDLHRASDSRAAGAALLWLGRQDDLSQDAAERLVSRLFDDHWRHQRDLANGEVLREALASVGADPTGFEPADIHQELIEAERELRDSGLVKAPSFHVRGEPFHGRAHFPLMRWLLSDRSSPPPA